MLKQSAKHLRKNLVRILNIDSSIANSLKLLESTITPSKSKNIFLLFSIKDILKKVLMKYIG